MAQKAAPTESLDWLVPPPAGVSANGGGDDDSPSSDDVPLAANHNSCRDFRARSSGNLRSDRTGRTGRDW